MRNSGLVVTDEGAPVAEAEQTVAEGEDIEEDEEDYSILIPSNPSHLDFEKSTMSEADVPMMMKLGYFGEAERKLVRFVREETTPAPKDDEVVVFKSFFRAGLCFPLSEMIGEVLKIFIINYVEAHRTDSSEVCFVIRNAPLGWNVLADGAAHQGLWGSDASGMSSVQSGRTGVYSERNS